MSHIKIFLIINFCVVLAVFQCGRHEEDEPMDAAGLLALKCQMSEHILTHYEDDAYQLAYRHLADSTDIRIDEKAAVAFQKLLSVVYQSSLPEVDSIFHTFNVYATGPSLQQLVVATKASQQPDEAVNTWLLANGLEIKESKDVGQNTYLTLGTSGYLNLSRAAEALQGLSSVTQVEWEQPIGASSDILYRAVGDLHVVEFIKGFGDCPSGCIHQRKWIFSINQDCAVKLLSVEGPPVPVQ